MNAMCARVITGVALAAFAAPSLSFARGCPPDSVQVGPVCVDKYEVSVWQIPDPTGVNRRLVKKVQKGKATLADLTAAGAIQLGCIDFQFPGQTAYPGTFPPDGNWTAPVYAASVPGVLPSSCTTWLQAEQACRLSGKRLPTNQEWQAAAAGTPDPGAVDDETTECNVSASSPEPVNTGSRSACTSSWGAFDMVGNVKEWVADWVPQSTTCPGWGGFSLDRMCLSGASSTDTAPGALQRGGIWDDEDGAGVFFIDGRVSPSSAGGGGAGFGFRCAR